MKKIVLMILVLFANSSLSSQIIGINIQESIITWNGKKVTGEHKGTINFKEGFLVYENEKIVGGDFIVDMTTINNTDQTGNDKLKLEGHIKSFDFFNITDFKTSQLVFKSITDKGKNLYKVIADLTIKGVTNPIKFDLIINKQGATAKLKVDRTKYGIQYGSGNFFDDIGDWTIYDEFDLNIDLKF
ncbi:YceI family protein [Flavobacterium luteum]|uniref:YceI family protein n=1 Tax=Flavobacterium luteum TaxID=2026654 RepID=A0A7J5AA55_9FLAO|nr:YceI family protein [Flavobacterium luteum]KAB1154430.1 YceI family protein [Flavobacterium luteum]